MTSDLHLWAAELIAAADGDNVRHAASPLPTLECQTVRVLQLAPSDVAGQAALALADLTGHARSPLDQVRSNNVAAGLSVTPGPNVAVARMTVPGGPWPGRFGLEAVVFNAQKAIMPGWFPPTHLQQPDWNLHFGSIVASTRAFRDGSGAVLFPELMSVSGPRPPGQAFGVVFADKLTKMYGDLVAPVAGQSGMELGPLRKLAFYAHEWGHRSVAPIEASSLAPSHRITSIIAEHHADLAALAMLTGSHNEEAKAAAIVLAADRIAREAWLNKADSQVQAIAARLLLDLLAHHGAVRMGGTLNFDLPRAMAAVGAALEDVSHVLLQCAAGDLLPAAVYLGSRGLVLQGKRWCSPGLDVAHASGRIAAAAHPA